MREYEFVEQNVRTTKKMKTKTRWKMHKAEVIKISGLIVFFWILCFAESFVQKIVSAIVVLCNGILCHGVGHRNMIMCDICVNIALCLWVNFTTNDQPTTIILTILACMLWLISTNSPNLSILHVFGVQWVLAYCLIHWIP